MELFTNEKFYKTFYEKYFLSNIRAQKEQKIVTLKQESMTLTQYKVKFNKLARFVPKLEDDDETRVRKFY